MEASFARERRARVLAPKVQENKGGRPAKSAELDVPQDGFWEEPEPEETSANLAEVSMPPSERQTRRVAAIGTGYSGSSIDKVDEIRRVAEQGVTVIGSGKDRREVEVPEPVREVARKQLPALAKTGAAIDPASKAVRRAVDGRSCGLPETSRSRAGIAGAKFPCPARAHRGRLPGSASVVGRQVLGVLRCFGWWERFDRVAL